MSKPNRLEARLAALKEANKKAFISFCTAGYPDLNSFPQLLAGLPKAGVDIIEIGVPFSDPMADGPVIQEANIVALKSGVTLPKILDMVREFRKTDSDTPIILMGYYNPIYSYGVMKFIDDAAKAGVDGFIVPDLPPEEDAEFREPAKKKELNLIRLVTPTTDEKRLPVILNGASGFLYYVSIAGITGAASAVASSLEETIARIRAQSPLPIAIGFGVNTPEKAAEMAAIADGVIVGSAIMKRITSHMESGQADAAMLDDVLGFVAALAKGAHG